MDVVKSIILVILATDETSEHSLTVLATWFYICLYQWRMVSSEIGEDFKVNKSEIVFFNHTRHIHHMHDKSSVYLYFYLPLASKKSLPLLPSLVFTCTGKKEKGRKFKNNVAPSSNRHEPMGFKCNKINK